LVWKIVPGLAATVTSAPARSSASPHARRSASRLYPRLPAWLRSETVDVAWKDLVLPGILWAASVAVGLVVVI